MSYEKDRRWVLRNHTCRVCQGQAWCAPSDGGGPDRDYLFYCELGCTCAEVYDQEDPADFFDVVKS